MTTVTFLKKVQHMRALQKRYFQLRKEGKVNDANTVLRECKAVESQIDSELPTVLVKEESLKLF